MAGIWGPKVMIINERAGSGGDLLPYMFKMKGIGPLVGTRTWGGLVGTWDTPRFIDGGRMVAPRGGFYDVDGNWAVEGEGVAPNIEVIQEPKLVIQGKDPQLERAVEEALRMLNGKEFQPKEDPHHQFDGKGLQAIKMIKHRALKPIRVFFEICACHKFLKTKKLNPNSRKEARRRLPWTTTSLY
jgi:hypothetical protein